MADDFVLVDWGDVEFATEVGAFHWILWVPSFVRCEWGKWLIYAGCYLDKSMQSAGAAGVWRADGARVP